MRNEMPARLILGVAICMGLATAAWADPVPLENAYWRFEAGPAGSAVPQGNDTVLDSINLNHMRTFSLASAPVYTSDIPTAIIPQTGAPNSLALMFSPNQDIYTDGKNINNKPITTAFTLEAAFKPAVLNRYQAIVGKDGQPTAASEQTFVLKMRGDTNELQIEQFDAGGTIHSVRSLAPLVADQWYYAAVVNDGATLSLYLDRNDGAGYVLQGSEPVAGALFENNTSWAIGRGMFNNSPADWFNGIIDEVRLSNTALDPSEFLCVPEPASVVLLGLGGLWVLRRRR